MRGVLILVLLVTMLVGCGHNSGRSSSSSTNQQGGVQAKQTAPEQRMDLSNEEVAQHLEQLAAGIPNVESAHVVLFGNTAVVGINVNPKLDRARIGTIKYTVAEALRKDPYGANAIVTADMDLDERIRTIRSEVKAGRPISGFVDELSKIVGRIMPQLPRDANPEATKPLPYGSDGTVNGAGTGESTKQDQQQLPQEPKQQQPQAK